MKLRDALTQQAPSLALQRAAADEIARLDALVASLRERCAAVADRHANEDCTDPFCCKPMAREIAAEIRALGL